MAGNGHKLLIFQEDRYNSFITADNTTRRVKGGDIPPGRGTVGADYAELK